MPIRIPSNLPAQNVLDKERIFVMDTQRAATQDIRPMEVGILNLMPNKMETEEQFLRLLSNTPLQINIDLIRIDNQAPKNTPAAHMDDFYVEFDDVVNKQYDGFWFLFWVTQYNTHWQWHYYHKCIKRTHTIKDASICRCIIVIVIGIRRRRRRIVE